MRSVIFGGLVAGVTLFVVGAAFHFFVVPVVAPGIPPQFENTALFRVWPGWTATYMAVHPFAYGFIFAAVFLGLRRWSGFPSGIRGGLVYGAGVFLVGSLPVFLLAFASFAVSLEVTFFWVMQSMVQYMLAGMALGWVVDGCQPTHPPVPLERAKYVSPPNVEWVEHPVVVLNSRVLLYHYPAFGMGLGRPSEGNSDPKDLYSDYYLIVETAKPIFVGTGFPLGHGSLSEVCWANR